jgi:hypothetical protein
MVTAADWKQNGRAGVLKKIGVYIVAAFVAGISWKFFNHIGLGFIPSIVAVLSLIAAIRWGLEYLKFTGRSSTVYVFRDGIKSLYGTARWSPDDPSAKFHGKPTLTDVILDGGSITFKLPGLWDDDIVVPVPQDHREQAKRVAHELMGTTVK